jgi:hypothetical protein
MVAVVWQRDRGNLPVERQETQVWRCQLCGTLNRLTFTYGKPRPASPEREKAFCAKCHALIADAACLSIQVTLVEGNAGA